MWLLSVSTSLSGFSPPLKGVWSLSEISIITAVSSVKLTIVRATFLLAGTMVADLTQSQGAFIRQKSSDEMQMYCCIFALCLHEHSISHKMTSKLLYQPLNCFCKPEWLCCQLWVWNAYYSLLSPPACLCKQIFLSFFVCFQLKRCLVNWPWDCCHK